MKDSSINESQYDLSYPPDEHAYIVGYCGLIANILYYAGVIQITSPLIYLVSIAYRAGAIKIIYDCTGRQNRDRLMNCLIGAVLPTIVLIVCGYSKKRRVAK